MANIRGISIKIVKHFIGTEGPAYQGNIYIGSKKVAFWSQDGNGGPDWFDMMNGFSKKKLVEAMDSCIDYCTLWMQIRIRDIRRWRHNIGCLPGSGDSLLRD